MNKQLVFFFLFFSTTATAKNPVTLQEMAHHIKHHPATVEREKAVNNLKKAAIASGACIVGGILFRLIMKDYGVAKTDIMSQKVGGLPIAIWTTFVWAAAELGGISFAIIKGCQGTKHLVLPDHNPVTPETHVRVKQAE